MDKILNIVYDSWDNGEPLPNLTKNTQTNSFRTVTGFFNFYDVIDNTRNCNISDVYKNPNENYFYFINPVGNSIHLFHKFKTIPLFSNVQKCLMECPNFNIVILNEHEPETEEYLKFIHDFCNERGFDKSRFFIMNNNSKLDEYKTSLQTNINVYSTEFLLKFIGKHLCRQDSKYVTEKEEIQFFMCHNRSPKVHRYVLLCLLMESGLINDVDWSMVMGWYRKSNINGDFYINLLSKEEIEVKYKKEIEILDNIDVKKSYYELNKEWFTTEEISPTFEWNQIYELKTYENSYVNIVTESNYLFREIHITEKSIKPFYFYQFPIFLSSTHHVKYLKNKYGFDLFDDVIDHSYDNETDNKKRLLMVYDEIKRLSKNKDELKVFYRNNKDRFEKNKQIVINISKSISDIEYFNALINKDIVPIDNDGTNENKNFNLKNII